MPAHSSPPDAAWWPLTWSSETEDVYSSAEVTLQGYGIHVVNETKHNNGFWAYWGPADADGVDSARKLETIVDVRAWLIAFDADPGVRFSPGGNDDGT